MWLVASILDGKGLDYFCASIIVTFQRLTIMNNSHLELVLKECNKILMHVLHISTPVPLQFILIILRNKACHLVIVTEKIHEIKWGVAKP